MLTLPPLDFHRQLKLLKVVLKNLADPVKSQDPKYQQLKLENPKVRAKILPCPSSLEYLIAIGFHEATDEQGERILRTGRVLDLDLMQASLQEVANGLDIVQPNTLKVPSDNEMVVKKHRTEMVEEKKEDVVRSMPERLSEKQKARILAEKAKEQERVEAKAQRRKVSQLILQDKYVRENDENWTSAPSAACAKTGNAISTFRDRHGEADN